MKLGFLEPQAIAAGIIWFVIIVMVSPFFGYMYVREDDYVSIERYEELQSEMEYLKTEYEGTQKEYEWVQEELQYCHDLMDAYGIAY